MLPFDGAEIIIIIITDCCPWCVLHFQWSKDGSELHLHLQNPQQDPLHELRTTVNFQIPGDFSKHHPWCFSTQRASLANISINSIAATSQLARMNPVSSTINYPTWRPGRWEAKSGKLYL